MQIYKPIQLPLLVVSRSSEDVVPLSFAKSFRCGGKVWCLHRTFVNIIFLSVKLLCMLSFEFSVFWQQSCGEADSNRLAQFCHNLKICLAPTWLLPILCGLGSYAIISLRMLLQFLWGKNTGSSWTKATIHKSILLMVLVIRMDHCLCYICSKVLWTAGKEKTYMLKKSFGEMEKLNIWLSNHKWELSSERSVAMNQHTHIWLSNWMQANTCTLKAGATAFQSCNDCWHLQMCKTFSCLTNPIFLDAMTRHKVKWKRKY